MTIADKGSETRYLDLDGDGVPDAVEIVTVDANGRDGVEVVDEVDAEIDDDGVAHSIAVSRVIVSEG